MTPVLVLMAMGAGIAGGVALARRSTRRPSWLDTIERRRSNFDR